MSHLKIELRTAMRHRRAAMGEAAIADAAAGFASRLEAALAQDTTCARPGIVAPRTIAGYWPIHGELDVRPALAGLRKRGWRVALPVMREGSRLLSFRLWEDGAHLPPNRHGILEPATGEAVTPDIILVPALAFDREGHRLGYGGGYYDATLAALPDARAIGCGYGWQLVDALPAEPHDRRLGEVILV